VEIPQRHARKRRAFYGHDFSVEHAPSAMDAQRVTNRSSKPVDLYAQPDDPSHLARDLRQNRLAEAHPH
jgi:hypothetical protein